MGEYLLGDYIKDYRQTHKLSLRDFGNMCGISHTTIDCIEKGYDPRTKKPINITNATFRKLSEAMGIPVHVLVDLSIGNDDLLRVPGGWAKQSFLAAQVSKGKDLPNQREMDTKEKKPTPVSGDGLNALDNELIDRLLRLEPDELAKVDAFVQGLLAARGA